MPVWFNTYPEQFAPLKPLLGDWLLGILSAYWYDAWRLLLYSGSQGFTYEGSKSSPHNSSFLLVFTPGRLGLLDYDEVELSNLHRQVLHREESQGHAKALSAATAVNRYLHLVFVQAHLEAVDMCILIRSNRQYLVIEVFVGFPNVTVCLYCLKWRKSNLQVIFKLYLTMPAHNHPAYNLLCKFLSKFQCCIKLIAPLFYQCALNSVSEKL